MASSAGFMTSFFRTGLVVAALYSTAGNAAPTISTPRAPTGPTVDLGYAIYEGVRNESTGLDIFKGYVYGTFFGVYFLFAENRGGYLRLCCIMVVSLILLACLWRACTTQLCLGILWGFRMAGF
jgi:hypothetical protein